MVIVVSIIYKSKIENESNLNKREIQKIKDSLECICYKIKAYENIKRGNIIAYYNYDKYFYYFAYKCYGIYAEPIISVKKREGPLAIMDSVLFLRYGKDFFNIVEKKSDSLYKIRQNFYIDLEGYHTSAVIEPKYQCSDNGDYYDFIIDSLLKLRLLPLKQHICFPNNLIIDAIITKEGKLINPRVLLKVNPKIDSTVASLLTKLPCDWIPANDGDSISYDYRKTFYFFFNK